ncbi:hypothetical protein B0H12DRAFT_1218023 [Mycena haematopus]|nr:hypothetical protein B0H12DRAFT_1218023 [Mycena haematopus]
MALPQDWRLENKWSAVGFFSGVVADLVAITPARLFWAGVRGVEFESESCLFVGGGGGGQHAAGDLRRTCVRLHLPSLTPPLFRSFATWSGPLLRRPTYPATFQVYVAACHVHVGTHPCDKSFATSSRAWDMQGLAVIYSFPSLPSPCSQSALVRVPSFCEPGVSLDAHAGVYFRVSIVPWDGGNQAIWKRDETYRRTKGDGGTRLRFGPRRAYVEGCQTRRDETRRDSLARRVLPEETRRGDEAAHPTHATLVWRLPCLAGFRLPARLDETRQVETYRTGVVAPAGAVCVGARLCLERRPDDAHTADAYPPLLRGPVRVQVLFRPPRLSPRIPDDSRVPHHTLRYDATIRLARPSTSLARPRRPPAHHLTIRYDDSSPRPRLAAHPTGPRMAPR